MIAVIVCQELTIDTAGIGSVREHPGGALIPLGNRESVFERQVRILSACGITRFRISAGSLRAQLEPLTGQKAFTGLEFTWTDDPVFNREKSILSCIPDDPVEEEMLILSGSLVFNRKFMQHFINGRSGTAFAVKELHDAPDNPFIVQASADGGIQTVDVPHGEADGNYYALAPLCRLQSGGNCIEQARIQVCNGILEELQSEHDSASILNSMTRSDMMEQTFLCGVYSILELEKLLAENGMQKPMIVCDAWRNARFLKAYLDSWLEYAVFETSSDTPDYGDILRGAHLFAEEKCDGLVSVGGDGPADAAKLIRLFSRIQDTQNYAHPEARLADVRHIAIPSGAGSGREAIPEAVMIKGGRQEKINCPGLLPDYVLLEPMFLDVLGAYQKKSVILDVICRCVDSIWAVHSDQDSQPAAKQALSGVLDNAFACLDGNMEAAAKVMRAQHICAKAVYISGVTAAYAAGCRLSALCGIGRGHGAGLCAAFFWEYYAQNIPHSRTDVSRKKLAAALFAIKDILLCKTDYEITELFSFLVSHTLGLGLPSSISSLELDQLAESLEEGVIENTPVPMDKEAIRSVCIEAFACGELWRGKALPEAPGRCGRWRTFYSYWQRCLSQSILSGMRKTVLEILDVTVRICEENALEYFLTYETLLGAVCSGGFLPCDDGIHIAMPRRDWERFIAVANGQLPPEYYIHYSGNDPNCWFDSIRVSKKGTHIEKKKDRFFYSRTHGIFISVHPADNIKHGIGPFASVRFKMCKVLGSIIQCRLNPASRRLRFKGRLCYRLLRILSVRRLHALLRRMKSKTREGAFALLGCRYSADREIVAKDQIYPLAQLEFEGRRYNAPRNWDAVLTRLYGDKKELPSEDARDYTKPFRVAFAPGKVISFVEAKKPKPKQQRTRKPTIKASMRKTVRSVAGRFNKLLERTGTRISGFFRTKGFMISERSRILASYQNKYAEQRCFLIGNGPSLKAEDLDRLKGEVTFGCNLIYKIFDQTTWRPTFYCVSDSTITRIHSRDLIENMDDSKLMIREFAYRYMHVRPWNAVRLPYISVDWYKIRGNMLAYHYISHATVMSMMIELAFYMGFKEIYLIGVDGTSASAKGGHFTDSYFSQELKSFADQVKKRVITDYDPKVRAAYLQIRTLEIFRRLREYAEKNGIKIFNATRGGVVEVFERADLDEIIATEKKD